MADKSAQELETDRRGIERKLPPTGELYKAVTEPVVVASAVEGIDNHDSGYLGMAVQLYV